MYSVDERDTVAVLRDLPQCDPGSPRPMLSADEQHVRLSYYLLDTPAMREAAAVHVVDMDAGGDPVALIRFVRARAHMFGPPNDEALEGHPLASRGLQPYGAFEVHQSSWIRGLERMNAVHDLHNPTIYSMLRHFVFVFHDSTFECVARDYSISLHAGTAANVLDWARPHAP